MLTSVPVIVHASAFETAGHSLDLMPIYICLKFCCQCICKTVTSVSVVIDASALKLQGDS